MKKWISVNSPDTGEVVEFEVEVLGNVYGRQNFRGYNSAYIEFPDKQRMTFTTLTSGGIKEQTARIAAYYANRELAEDAFDQQMYEFINNKDGHIHWRKFPETLSETVYTLEFNQLVPMTLYYTIARVAVNVHTPRAM